MMASDRVIVNAGGRLFETTTTTLSSCGSAYFEALLGATGAALGTLSRAEEVAAAVTAKPHERKRACRYHDEDQETVTSCVKELFVDRDPHLFAEVLHYMRSGGLSAKARRDMALLEDLQAEALFFGFDELEKSCEETLREIRAAMDDALKPAPEPTARCHNFIVEAEDHLGIQVPEGQVLYIASATLSGRVRSFRYRPLDDQVARRREKQEKDRDEHEENIAYNGCYISTCKQDDSGDFQLEASVALEARQEWVSIAHAAIDHFRVDKEMGLNVDFRQDIRQCLAPDRENGSGQVFFRSRGAGDWHLACWIGDPAAIPQVAYVDNRSTKKRGLERSQAATAGNVAAAAAVDWSQLVRIFISR